MTLEDVKKEFLENGEVCINNDEGLEIGLALQYYEEDGIVMLSNTLFVSYLYEIVLYNSTPYVVDSIENAWNKFSLEVETFLKENDSDDLEFGSIQ